MSASVPMMLQDYAALYAQAYGREESVAELVPAMLAAFLESDRNFIRGRSIIKMSVETDRPDRFVKLDEVKRRVGVGKDDLSIDPGGEISRSLQNLAFCIALERPRDRCVD